MAEMNEFALKIITPERVFFEGMVRMVELNTTEGEVGIYAKHIPMTLIIKPGILTITQDEVKHAALHAGFVEVLEDQVTVLAEVIEWPDEIDLERAEKARERAEQRMNSKTVETDIARAETALQRSLARIQIIK